LPRVQKIISSHAHISRRQAEELIKQGKVKVNGRTAKIGDDTSDNASISIDSQLVKRTRRIYLLFNKPTRCVTALKDSKYPTVMDYIKIKESVFPVGRLDFNTTGLLLLTNDGDFANKVMHPSHQIKKSYLTRIDRAIDSRSLKLLERGVDLDDGKSSPARIRVLARNLLEITIHEGRNRIIRRMLEAVGYKVKALERVAIGKLSLSNLRPGRYRKLTPKDIQKIFV
jgi:23S rRNA pseudouridine2605 synthase